MLYGSQETKPLHDRSTAPAESMPFVQAICWAFTGAEGRKEMRKRLGPEHEKSNMDIPGMRGFPVWRYVLRAGAVEAAPEGVDVDGLPTVYLLGPTAKKFTTVSATISTTGPEAAAILSVLAETLGVRRDGEDTAGEEPEEIDDISSFECLDCQADTSDIDEYYMVEDAVWHATGLTKHDGMLCIGCLEARIGRRLVPADFTDTPVNRGFFRRSERLLDRLKSSAAD